jgi:hypothetical protein
MQASDDISSRGELEKAPIALYTALWVDAALAGTALQPTVSLTILQLGDDIEAFQNPSCMPVVGGLKSWRRSCIHPNNA